MTDKELFEFIDVEEMLTELGIQKVRDTHSGEIQFSCPFPGHNNLDTRPSAYMSTEERQKNDGTVYPKTTFHCFTCEASGTAITFLAEYEGVSPVTAKRWLRERFAKDYIESDRSTREIIDEILDKKEVKVVIEPDRILNEKILDKFAIDWFEVDRFFNIEGNDPESFQGPLSYMFERGFSPNTLDHFDIGFDEISERLTIPARDIFGSLVGFKGRAWWPDAKAKYITLGGEDYGFKPYESGRILWAGHIAAAQDDPVWIVREGELNTMKLHEHQIINSVGFSGKTLTRHHLYQLREFCEGVILWCDDILDSYRNAEELERSMPVWIVWSEKDPAEMNFEEIRDALKNKESSLKSRFI